MFDIYIIVSLQLKVNIRHSAIALLESMCSGTLQLELALTTLQKLADKAPTSVSLRVYIRYSLILTIYIRVSRHGSQTISLSWIND